MAGVAQQGGDIAGQGLGTLLNVADLVMAARKGSLGSSLMARQAALQDPATRASIANSPLMAGFLGAYGSRGPSQSPPTMTMTPNAVEVPQYNGPSEFRANLPPLSQAGQLDLQDKSSAIAYRQSQERSNDAQASYQQSILDRIAGSGGSGPRTLGKITMGPSGPSVEFPSDSTERGPEGTINPDTGQPFRPGDKIRKPGVSALVIPDKAKANREQKLGVSLDRQLKSLDSAVIGFEKLFGKAGSDVKDTALSILPSGQGARGQLESYAGAIPGVRELTRGGSIGIPGVRPSIEILARGGDTKAQTVISGGGLRALLARMTGEVGNLNENEQKVIADAFLPSKSDSVEAAKNKRDLFYSTATAIRAGLASGQLTPETAKSAWFEAVGQTPPTSAPAANGGEAQTSPATPRPKSLKGPQVGANGLYDPADAARLLMRK